METGFMNKITGLVIALVVGGLLVGGLLIPSIEGMTATETTFENEGLFYMTQYSEDDTIPTIIWDHTTPDKLTVGEDVLTLADSTIPQSIVFGDNWAVRYDAETASLSYVQLFGNANGIIVSATTQNELDMTISFESGTVTVTNGTDTSTQPYTTLYCIAKTGAYVMKNPNDSVYLKDDSQAIVVGRTILLNWGPINFKFSGDIKDGFEAEPIYPTSGYTVDNYTVDDSAIQGYVELYTLSKVTFDITNSESVIRTATYSQFVVPASITAEKAQHMDATQIAMFGVISILGIVALVVVAANGIRNKY